jgi:hypothetical protein
MVTKKGQAFDYYEFMGFIKSEFEEVRKFFEKDSLISRILLILSTPIFLFLYGLPGVLLTIWFWDADQSNYAGLVIKIPLNFFLIVAILAFLIFVWLRYADYSNEGYYNQEISKIEKNKKKNKEWRVDKFWFFRKRYDERRLNLRVFYVSYFVFCTWFVYFVWQAVFD